MTKLTLTEQEELFAKDCKLINLRYEYTNYTGKEKWAVITELTEKELRKKYPDIIKRCTFGKIQHGFHRFLYRGALWSRGFCELLSVCGS